jgi:ubiquinone/menaquinone biosynthesis C-methylase UbiE
MVTGALPREETALEFLDRPVPPAALAATLADMDRFGAWFGGHALSLRAIRRVAGEGGARPLVILDVGGGDAAFAARLALRARRQGRRVRVLVVDRDAATLALAQRVAASYAEIALVQADATALPFRAGAVDVVTATLTLHHLTPDAAVAALREMRAVARRAVVVNDLLRSRLTLALVWLATRAFRCHPISRHDGPLSVRRAYSRAELAALAARAGVSRLAIRAHPAVGRLVAVLG